MDFYNFYYVGNNLKFLVIANYKITLTSTVLIQWWCQFSV